MLKETMFCLFSTKIKVLTQTNKNIGFTQANKKLDFIVLVRMTRIKPRHFFLRSSCPRGNQQRASKGHDSVIQTVKTLEFTVDGTDYRIVYEIKLLKTLFLSSFLDFYV